MQYSIVAVAGLAAVVLASPDPAYRRQVPASVSSSILAEISSIEAGLLPPPSIAAELSAVPPAVTSALLNPSAFSAVEASIIANGIPGWFSSLPADAKSYVLGVQGPLSSAQAEISSLQAQLTGVSNSSTAGNSTITTAKSTSTLYSNSTITTSQSSTASSTTSKASTSASSSTKPSSSSTSSSKAGAAPTGVIAAGAMGLVGFLGVALAL